jgi:hypothetical protein
MKIMKQDVILRLKLMRQEQAHMQKEKELLHREKTLMRKETEA